MNKFNKGKLVGVVAASLSAVSLMGVGFATWIICTQKTTIEESMGVVADEVKYKALTISAQFNGGLVLAENATDKTKDFSSDSNQAAKLTISTDFTFTFGRDFIANDYQFDQLSFKILPAAKGTTDFVDNTIVDGGNKMGRTEENLTYFDVTSPISLTAQDLGLSDTATDTDLTRTKTIQKNIVFTWGSMFKLASGVAEPTAYYNDGLSKVTAGPSTTLAQAQQAYMEKAYKELDAMHGKYSASGTQIKLEISLTKKATA